MSSEDVQRLTLYMNPVSVRSIMVRFAFAMRGDGGVDSTPIAIEERVVNIFELEQLEEWYFEVNPKAQVIHFPYDPTYTC